MVTKRDVLVARNDGIAMIKGELEYAEKVNAELKRAVGLSESKWDWRR